MAYPEKGKRGKYLAYWLASRVIGVNSDRSQKGPISVNTYLICISIQALGPFVVSPLSSAGKIQRSDRTPAKIDLSKGLVPELKAMGGLLCRKEILHLTPIIFQCAFSEVFFCTYNATYFAVQSRALLSLVASTCVIMSTFALGFFLDSRKLSVNHHAIVAFVAIYIFEAGLYIYAMVM